MWIEPLIVIAIAVALNQLIEVIRKKRAKEQRIEQQKIRTVL